MATQFEQHEEALKGLEYISTSAGLPVDYTQGGGGNTSVKLNDTLMAVKASGYKLKQINPTDGYVVVDYAKVADYHKNVDLTEDRDFEKESGEFVRSTIQDWEGLKKLRPSVEAGFHSILKKYVIHTHSVYANILCCAENGKAMVEKIFAGKEYGVAWVPYINPGFTLTLNILEAIDASLKNSGKFPKVIFMQNHGLIVSDDDSRACVELHQEVNDTVRQALGSLKEFPAVELEEQGEDLFASKTGFIREFLLNNEVKADYFDKYSLYPDQLVYLNGNVTVDATDKKMSIDSKTGAITYRTNLSEAQTIEETLLAYLYVIQGIRDSGLVIRTMTEKDIDFIRNWESEAYRKSLVKQLGK